MTKRKPGAPPGNTNAQKPEGEHYIRKLIAFRPDQVERLALESNANEVVRRAVDNYFSIHSHADDAEYDKAYREMAAKPPEREKQI